MAVILSQGVANSGGWKPQQQILENGLRHLHLSHAGSFRAFVAMVSNRQDHPLTLQIRLVNVLNTPLTDRLSCI
jgi:hypothetical protein